MRLTLTHLRAAAMATVTAGVVAQFALAGVGVFGVRDFEAHMVLGHLLLYGSVLAFGATAMTARTRKDLGLAGALVVAMLVQGLLPLLQDDYASVASLHVTNALLVAFLTERNLVAAFRPLPCAWPIARLRQPEASRAA